jgi:hypothetical protein
MRTYWTRKRSWATESIIRYCCEAVQQLSVGGCSRPAAGQLFDLVAADGKLTSCPGDVDASVKEVHHCRREETVGIVRGIQVRRVLILLLIHIKLEKATELIRGSDGFSMARIPHDLSKTWRLPFNALRNKGTLKKHSGRSLPYTESPNDSWESYFWPRTIRWSAQMGREGLLPLLQFSVKLSEGLVRATVSS